MRIFVSYAHRNGDWVHQDLIPVLSAAGAETLVDVDYFKAGQTVIGQMDSLQSKARRHILVITKEYLESQYCCHEMEQAIKTDSIFSKNSVIVVRRDEAPIPTALAGNGGLGTGPLYVDLQDNCLSNSWDLLIKSCGLNLYGLSATTWLRARDDALKYLHRDESVNLVGEGSNLIVPKNIVNEIINKHNETFIDIDFSNPLTHTRRGFIQIVSKSIGLNFDVPSEPEDLMFLHNIFENRNQKTFLCLRNFDLIFGRKKDTI